MRNFLKQTGLAICWGLGYLLKLQGIPILAYHSIDDSNSNISISPEIFDRQMNYLKGSGLHVTSLAQLMTVLYEREVPEKILVLTFDDGLKNFYEAAWPILNKYGFSATVFVPTDFIGEKSR